MLDASHTQRLIDRLDRLGVPYGREDSFKLSHRRILSGRIQIGVDASGLAIARLLAIATELGMPDACLDVLLPRAMQANAVFFGFEAQGQSCVCKVHLEFWDAVRRETERTGSQAPQLLQLGVKWDSDYPGHHEVARYDCHPLLNLGAILRRMVSCYGDASAQPLCALAQEIVRAAAERNQAASMLYLEVSEQGNARSSFDINLYKSGVLVADAAAQLRQAGACFQIPEQSIEAELARLGHCPLGHLSSGLDRHGKLFLTVYAETASPRS